MSLSNLLCYIPYPSYLQSLFFCGTNLEKKLFDRFPALSIPRPLRRGNPLDCFSESVFSGFLKRRVGVGALETGIWGGVLL